MSNDDLISEMLNNMGSPSKHNKGIRTRCPVDGCDYHGTAVSVAMHVENKSFQDHKWKYTKYNNKSHFLKKKGHKDKPNVICPAKGCFKKDYSPKSIVKHFNESDDDTHEWSETKYKDWKHFIDSTT